MPFVERNHPIETFAPCRPDEAFTVRIGLRRPHWRLQHLKRHRPKGLVHGWRENAIAIMDEEAIGAFQRQAVSELLDRPFRSGAVSEIPVHHPACADVEEDEDVQPSKGGRNHDEEVAGEHGAGMIVEERRPWLGRSAATTSRPWRHVASHRARRHRQTKLHAELRSNALFTPGVIVSGHIRDEPLHLNGNAGAPALT